MIYDHASEANKSFDMHQGHSHNSSNSRKKSSHRKNSKKKIPISLSINEQFTEAGIPKFLQHSYINGLPPPSISKLRDWQLNLITSKEWRKQKSTIILVPTSGGKTVAADIATAQQLEKDPYSKVIYALPFIALASEKFSEYTQRFFSFTVRGFYQNVGGSDFKRGQIAICTYEKAHSLLNSAISGNYSDKIQLVIIDEVHLIGDESRGAVIEALIVKLRLLKHNPRIIGLTATISPSDAIRLSSWIDGFPFISSSRPSTISQFIIKSSGIVSRVDGNNLIDFFQFQSIPGDRDHIVEPIRLLLSRNPTATCLIFVSTRSDTLRIAIHVSQILFSECSLPPIPSPTPDLIESRKQLVKNLSSVTGSIEHHLSKCIMSGVGIHHAGLLLEERKLIETAARNHVLNVLVSTTTLSAGINIHSVSRVIIYSLYHWNGKTTAPLQQSVFTQMVGRTGRSSSCHGQAYIILHTNKPEEEQLAIQLSHNFLSPLETYLSFPKVCDRFFLQCVSLSLIPPNGLRDFLSLTLEAYNPNYSNKENDPILQNSLDDQLKVSSLKSIDVKSVMDHLVKEQLMTISEDGKDIRPTKLGLAIAGSSISVGEGRDLIETIERVENALCLNDEIHLAYLCVSPVTISQFRPEPYDSPAWIQLAKDHEHVINLITGLDKRKIDYLQDLPKIYGNGGHRGTALDGQLDRIYAAAVLTDLINERPIGEITKWFNMDRGAVQTLQMQCALSASQVAKFCEITGDSLLAATLSKFKQRLNFAAKSELLELMILPSCSRNIARALFSAGVSDISMLSEIDGEIIASVITPIGPNGKHLKPTEMEIEIANRIIAEAKEYSESLAKIEELEQDALEKILAN